MSQRHSKGGGPSMKRLLFLFIVTFVIGSLCFAQGQRGGGAPPAPPMTLTVAGFPDGGDIPVKYTQAAPGVPNGEGTSPELKWANVPPGTQSFMLNMHDMEASRNKTTDDQAHW